MNDIERAIEILKTKYVKSCKMVDGRLAGGFIDDKKDVNIAINKAIEALEKQAPKNPKVSYDNEFTDADGNRGMCVRHIECPNCESELGYDTDYCSSCGQRIEWEV